MSAFQTPWEDAADAIALPLPDFPLRATMAASRAVTSTCFAAASRHVVAGPR